MANDIDCQTLLADHPRVTALLVSALLLLGSAGSAVAANIGNSGP
jgi:ABC-type transporter Mla maintaining outer membrane lipid asymmetry permease subunit MlaE